MFPPYRAKIGVCYSLVTSLIIPVPGEKGPFRDEKRISDIRLTGEEGVEQTHSIVHGGVGGSTGDRPRRARQYPQPPARRLEMTTPFDLEIRFTGICGIVPNTDPHGNYSLCVVMPSDTARQSIDGESLCPHECYVGFFAAEPSPPPYPGPKPLKTYPLKNCRVALEVSPHSGTPPDLPSSEAPFLLELAKLIGSYAVIDASIVNSNPPPPVIVQILLNDGTTCYRPDTTATWNIASLDDGKPRSNVTLVHEVALSLTAVTSARLMGKTFDGSTTIDIDLDPATVPGAAFVRIVNLCTHYSPQMERDRDFKWYYELLIDSAKKSIGNELRQSSADLPIPRRYQMAGGQNCFPGKLPAVTFGT